MNRRRRRPNGRFWALMALAVIIVVAAVYHHQPVHPNAAVSHKDPTASFLLTRWTVAPTSLSQPVMGFSAVTTPGVIWVLGGLINDQSTSLIQKVSISKLGYLGPVTASPVSTPVPVHDAAAVVYNHQILLLGGGQYVSTASVISLPLPRLTPSASLTPLPMPLSDLAAVKAQSRVLVIGGHASGTPSATIWSYVPSKAAAVFGHLPTGVRYPAAAYTPRTLYVIGGLTSAGVTHQAVAYNLATGKMTVLPPYPLAVQYAEAAIIGHRLVVAGGKTNAGWTSAVFWYDAARKVWKRGPSLPKPVGYGAFLTMAPTTGVWLGGEGDKGEMNVIWTIKGINRP